MDRRYQYLRKDGCALLRWWRRPRPRTVLARTTLPLSERWVFCTFGVGLQRFNSVILPLLQRIMQSVISGLQVRTTHSNSGSTMWLPIAHQDTPASGGSTLAGYFSVDLRCSLLLLVLSSACRCLNTLSKCLSGRAAGGLCASNRACTFESRMAP